MFQEYAYVWKIMIMYYGFCFLKLLIYTLVSRYMFFWYYFDRNLKRTSNGRGCRKVFWSISVGSRSGKNFPSGSITVANCIRVAINRNMRDLANTSPIQFLFPIPKTSTLFRTGSFDGNNCPLSSRNRFGLMRNGSSNSFSLWWIVQMFGMIYFNEHWLESHSAATKSTSKFLVFSWVNHCFPSSSLSSITSFSVW